MSDNFTAISKDSDKCKKCEFYEICKDKEMELCGMIVPENRLAQNCQPIAQPIIQPVIEEQKLGKVYIDEESYITIDYKNLEKEICQRIFESACKEEKGL